jgi:hypothetical protein
VVAPDDAYAADAARRGCLTGASNAVLRVSGPLDAPVFSGKLAAKGVSLSPRSFGRTFSLAQGATVTLRPGKGVGRQRVAFPRQARLRGDLDDGTFALWGSVDFDRFSLDDADLSVVGTDLFFASSGEFNLTFNPSVHLAVSDFGRPQSRRMALSGDVVIVDGTYYKSFDSFARAFGAATGGARDAYQEPLTERVPWLKDLALNLDVTSTVLAVRSPFPFGRADLDARVDVSVSGTLDKPQVFNRIDLLPGGVISYRVLGREFELLSGSLDFSGDPGRPRIDLQAQTEVEFLERVGSGDESEERQVTIIVTITGTLPDDLSIQLSSTPGGFDQADLQSLILAGKPLDDDVLAREDNLFSFDIGRFVDALLAAPFVDAINVGLTQDGFVDTELVTKFGRDLRLRTRAVQESGDATRLTARFQFRISDSVVLEGSVDRSTGATADEHETYQTRIKYRIHLD